MQETDGHHILELVLRQKYKCSVVLATDTILQSSSIFLSDAPLIKFTTTAFLPDNHFVWKLVKVLTIN